MSTSASQPGLRLVDSHAHLDMPAYETDREEALKRAHEAGVAAIVSVGIDLPSSRQAVLLAAKYPSIYAAVGIHPQEAGNVTEKDVAALSVLIRGKRVVKSGWIFIMSMLPRTSRYACSNGSWHLRMMRDCPSSSIRARSRKK